MITIEGTARGGGIAIAVAAVVDAQSGINGIAPEILQEGINALRRRLPPEEMPEVVVASDLLAMGASIRIPGVTTAAVVAQSDADVPGLEPGVPCVIAVADLLRSIGKGDILIVDGERGIVHIDPDPQTLIRYQHRQQREEPRHTVFISSEHIPARTPSGETVYVHALVSGEDGLAQALEQGADGLVVELWGPDSGECCGAVLQAAMAKPVVFAVPYVEAGMLRAAMRFSTPGQVTAALPAEDFAALAAEAETALDSASTEAFLNDLDAPRVSLGALVTDVGGEVGPEARSLVVDLRGAPCLDTGPGEALDLVGRWTADRRAEDVVFVLGGMIDALGMLVNAGARSLAVAPAEVASCKSAIRSIGLEEAE